MFSQKTLALGWQSEIEKSFFFNTFNGCGEEVERPKDMSEGKGRVGGEGRREEDNGLGCSHADADRRE